VAAQHFTQGLVHQVGGRVVAHGARTALRVDLGRHGVAHLERAALQRALVAKHVGLDLGRVSHGEDSIACLQHALVTGLAAGFGVERGVVEHYHASLARLHGVDRGAVHI
jgi:hypothetical protein